MDNLNAAAHQLMRARDDVSGSQSGSGLAEALERIELANSLGGLGRQAAGLLPMVGSASMQQQIQALAAKQRALAQELEKLKAQGQVSGAGDMSGEASGCHGNWRLDGSTARWWSGRSGCFGECSTRAGPCRGRKKTRTRNAEYHCH